MIVFESVCVSYIIGRMIIKMCAVGGLMSVSINVVVKDVIESKMCLRSSG